MKNTLAFALMVALLAPACGKSRALREDGGAAGAPIAGRGGAVGATAGSGGAEAGAGAGGGAGAGNAAGADGGGTAGGAAAGRGGAGGSVVTSGDGGASGGADGGVDAPRACATGETRCDAAGHRLRCTADGSWADDNYVCTVALSGSSDYNVMCALKADGRLACWASGDWANGQAAMMVARAPAGTWRQISVGDGPYELCAISTEGKVSCWNAYGDGVFPAPPGTFATFSFSDYGSCGITDTGAVACFNGVNRPSDFVGTFKQIVTANSLVYGIDANEKLHVPDFVAASYPAARYKQLTANNSASCAIRADGAIFCFPSNMLPPPAEADFVEVAATYGNFQACAIRTDGTVTCWLGDASMKPLSATPGGTFTHIAGCEGAMCGIRSDGTTVCWGNPDFEPLLPPAGW